MIKDILKNVHNLEDLLVECAEMCNFSSGINKLLADKNLAYLKEKEAEAAVEVEITNCEMFRYLSAT